MYGEKIELVDAIKKLANNGHGKICFGGIDLSNDGFQSYNVEIECVDDNTKLMIDVEFDDGFNSRMCGPMQINAKDIEEIITNYLCNELNIQDFYAPFVDESTYYNS